MKAHKRPVSLLLPDDMHSWVKAAAEAESRSSANFIVKMLRDKMLQEQSQANKS